MTVYAGKWFKALTDSGAAISLMSTSVYNMIKDHYKTSVWPTVSNLRTAYGSPMSLMGKATLHLWIEDFKFSHTFVICDRLPETDFLFGHQPTEMVFLILLLELRQTSLHTKGMLFPDIHQKQVLQV